MLKDNDRISSWQAIVFLIMTINAINLLSDPRLAADFAGTAGWIGITLGHVLAGVGALVIIALGHRFPNETLFEYAPRIVGRIPGTIINAAFVLFWLFMAAAIARSFGDFVKEFLLTETPIEILLFLLLLVSVYAVRHGLEPMARVMEIFFYLFVLTMVFVILLGVQQADFTRLLPIIDENGPGILQVSWKQGTGLEGIEMFVLLLPFLLQPKRARTVAMVGLGFTLVLRVALFVITIAVFGPQETKRLVWPAFDILRAAEVPGGIFNRPEGILISTWVPVAFTSIIAYLYFAMQGMARMFRLRAATPFAFTLLPVIFVVSMIPDNIVTGANWRDAIGVGYSILLFGVLPLLLLIAWIRGLKGTPSANSSQGAERS